MPTVQIKEASIRTWGYNLKNYYYKLKTFVRENTTTLAFGSIIVILAVGGGYYIGRKVGEAGTPNILYNEEWRKFFRKD